jgi:integrase
MEGGERLPLLIAQDGAPLFRPTVWLLTMRRATHVSSNTLQANCFAIKLLYLWAVEQNINIEDRMLFGQALLPHELSGLVGMASQHLEDLGKARQPAKADKVVSLEQVRMRASQVPRAVSKHTSAYRLRVIADYLRWLGQEGVGCLPVPAAAARKEVLDEMLSGLLVRTPKVGGRNVVGKREATPPDVMDRLLKIIEPDSPENPWKEFGLRIRNRLLIHLMYGLGIRRGEALGIKIDRIRWRENSILIARTADDPADSRKRQPLAKTRDRWLPVKDGLMDMMQQYVTHIRSKIPRARQHQFLFVSHQGGAPLALVSCNKIFTTLRTRVKEIPDNMTPHLLRHAWNDAFSQLIDEKNIEPAKEEKMRSEMMGWSPTSGTATTYNRRHIQSEAEKMSLALQKELLMRATSAD